MYDDLPGSEFRDGISKTSENLFGSHFSPIARGPLGQFSAPEDALGLQSSDRATALVYA